MQTRWCFVGVKAVSGFYTAEVAHTDFLTECARLDALNLCYQTGTFGDDYTDIFTIELCPSAYFPMDGQEEER